MTDDAVGMRTNGVGERVDWLNRTRSLADDPEFFSEIAGQPRHDGYVALAVKAPVQNLVTWQGKPVSERNAAILWGQKA